MMGYINLVWKKQYLNHKHVLFGICDFTAYGAQSFVGENG